MVINVGKKLSLTVLILHICYLCGAQYSLFVSNSGNDQFPGTIEKPLKTIEVAIQRLSGIQQTNVTIFLRAGKYAPHKVVQISPDLLRNHKLEISSYEDELVTITGSKEIKPKWKSYSKTIVEARIEKHISIDQLYCNGLPL